jgi:hypothetical protein
MLIIMQLTPEQRRLIGVMIKQKISKKVIAATFSCSRVTVWYWSIQDLRTRFNIKNNADGKITVEIEASILYLRQTFKWGTARIQQGLMSLPPFMKEEIKVTIQYECIQNFKLSRQAINKILKKHGLNGYGKKKKTWKFFRAKYANELWQLDLKKFKFQGKEYQLLVVIDDYSRFLLKLHVFEHAPDIPEICDAIKLLVKEYHPESILTDNSPFKQSWEEWCKEQGTEALFAHPYYPQDKGKVERTIRNVSEEFVYLLTQFEKWFSNKCFEEYRCWFNDERFHRGVKDYPANLFVKC